MNIDITFVMTISKLIFQHEVHKKHLPLLSTDSDVLALFPSHDFKEPTLLSLLVM